ncbi:hypothetical protein SAMN05216276_1013146 [Streptosporangium subroseum]|uniref:WD domain-containing protein, G-beta repeat-containing protein n=1 Tax=Streptosporangium subroseum TaxID=106412 RepID=A0A239GEH2_9ACTN|nr:hypothetical protein [Streptosporangium subroseum]SNS67122.1 hypothetical protein SAMN05216276_1013146 [Streptosporangium subroseum]
MQRRHLQLDVHDGVRGDRLTGHTDRVWAVAVGLVGGFPVAVSGSRDETVRVWSLAPPFPAPGS